MTQLVDREGRGGQPPSDGVELVRETKRFLQAWQRILTGPAEWAPGDIEALRKQSRELEVQARAANVGGLGHHLATCEQCLAASEVDRLRLAQCLRNVSEVAWQLRHEWRARSESFALEDSGQMSPARLTIDPPALLTPPSIDLFAAVAEAPEVRLDERVEHGSEMLPDRTFLGLRAFGLDPAVSGQLGGALPSLPQIGRPRPPLLGPDPSGLPELDLPPPGAEAQPLAADLDRRLMRIGRARRGSFPSLADPMYPHDETRGPLESLGHPRSNRSRIPWWSGPLLVGAIGTFVVVALALSTSPSVSPIEEAKPPPTQPVEAAQAAPLGSPRLTDDSERLRGLLAQVHGHGGLESPELADLLDEEAAVLGQGIARPCVAGSPSCQLGATVRELLSPGTLVRIPRDKPSELGRWLAGLKLPGIGVKDDRRVRDLVEFHTESAVGRETFQVLLFQCGAYQDLFHQMLVRYGLPLDLMALVMVESGCVPDIESPVGARGLWQFMPATARAYHLRVKPGVLDERINPTKSTDAAVRFLADLYRKMGSWELAIASYNLGPFGLLARLRQAGDDVGFWELADGGRLPQETARYVPKVQAFAFILSNLAHFHFEAAQLRSPQMTADLDVPPGTRIGLIARAASSSTSKIRELNPDVVGDRVPDLPGEKFAIRVPKEAIFRAREALAQLLADGDRADECVPHTFDWGRQRFTKAMASRCPHAGPIGSLK